MSTRCQIGFSNEQNKKFMTPNVLLYKHCDGYPYGEDGVLKTIIPTIMMFMQRRSIMNDVEYLSAWMLHHLIAETIDYLKTMQKKGSGQHLPKDGINFLGFGICDNFHLDIEYYYHYEGTDSKNGFLSVYKVHVKDWDHGVLKNDFKLLRKLQFKIQLGVCEVYEIDIETNMAKKVTDESSMFNNPTS
jgi:hypothetical protein